MCVDLPRLRRARSTRRCLSRQICISEAWVTCLTWSARCVHLLPQCRASPVALQRARLTGSRRAARRKCTHSRIGRATLCVCGRKPPPASRVRSLATTSGPCHSACGTTGQCSGTPPRARPDSLRLGCAADACCPRLVVVARPRPDTSGPSVAATASSTSLVSANVARCLAHAERCSHKCRRAVPPCHRATVRVCLRQASSCSVNHR